MAPSQSLSTPSEHELSLLPPGHAQTPAAQRRPFVPQLRPEQATTLQSTLLGQTIGALPAAPPESSPELPPLELAPLAPAPPEFAPVPFEFAPALAPIPPP
jgi:hypothetical protein